MDKIIIELAMPKPGAGKIYIRREGKSVEISEEEFKKLSPDKEPHRVMADSDWDVVWSGEFKSEWRDLAREAGLEQGLWEPYRMGLLQAFEIEPVLLNGAHSLYMKANNQEEGFPDEDYFDLVNMVEKYIRAGLKYPEARIRIKEEK